MKKTRKNSLLVALISALVLSLFFGTVSFASASSETLDYSKTKIKSENRLNKRNYCSIIMLIKIIYKRK